MTTNVHTEITFSPRPSTSFIMDGQLTSNIDDAPFFVFSGFNDQTFFERRTVEAASVVIECGR